MSGPVPNENQPQPNPQEHVAGAGAFVQPTIQPEAEQVMKAHDAEGIKEIDNKLAEIGGEKAGASALETQQTSISKIPEPTSQSTQPAKSIGIGPFTPIDSASGTQTVEEYRQNRIKENLKNAA